MNKYMILASSDEVFDIFDVYIDMVEAWTACEAIQKFAHDNFSFKEMYTIRRNQLRTKWSAFIAVLVLVDTSPREDAQYILYDINLKERRKKLNV